MSFFLRCRKCRNIVIRLEEVSVIDIHGGIINKFDNSISLDCGGNIISSWYLQENELPKWIITILNSLNWLKGKLNCPQCNSRIGSFDFISGTKCVCRKNLIPSVHIVKSKVDLCSK